MKIYKFMAIAAICGLFAACTPEEKPDNGKTDEEQKEEQKPEEKPELSTACRLVSVTIHSGANERECTVYEKEKEVDVLDIFGWDLTEVSFDVAISDKATHDLDLSKTYDVTGDDLTITVTAEDGKTTATYTFVTRVPELAFTCEPEWTKTTGEMGLKGNKYISGSVAFAGTDKIAFAEGFVTDLNGKKLGDINLEGFSTGTIYNISNDVNGVLVATEYNEDDNYGSIFVWIDGYDKAPVKIYTNEGAEQRGNPVAYMSCGGDATGDFLVTCITGGRGAMTHHHLFEFHNMDWANVSWHDFQTELVSNDGNWGQMVSPTSGDVNGWYAIGDSEGNNNGYHIYTRHGWEMNFEDNELWGTTICDGLVPDGVGGADHNNWYGNYSTGHVKGFQFKGIDYVIATTTGWPCTYVTIQGMIPTRNDDGDVVDEHYLMRTTQLNGAEVVPSSSYVYDPVEEVGRVVTNTTTEVVLWTIEGDIM